MKICQYCGTVASDEAVKCQACNAASFSNVCNNCKRTFDSAFCPGCGLKAGEKGKFCIKCGTNYYSACCPNCGYSPAAEATSTRNMGYETLRPADCQRKDYMTCQDLCRKLEEIEASRPKKGFFENMSGMVAKAWNKKTSVDKTDQLKLEAISGFVIPDDRTEIINLITLADSRGDTCEELAWNSSDSYFREIQESLAEAWTSKRDEAIKKGERLLQNDSDFLKIRWDIQSRQYIGMGLCRYCGGSFKGLFKKVCSICGREKDY